jgi:hypothetical protein
MDYTIVKQNQPIEYYDLGSKQQVKINAYAFIDNSNRTIIIAPGEARRDAISQHLNK